MSHPPHLRYGVFAVGASTALVAFEMPDYEPAADEAGRGRVDHFALRVHENAFLAVRGRLVASGASDGVIEVLGPFRALSFRDPDGTEGKVMCPNRESDPTHVDDELLECSNPQWTANLLSG
jgi:hypothetical protein